MLKLGSHGISGRRREGASGRRRAASQRAEQPLFQLKSHLIDDTSVHDMRVHDMRVHDAL